MQKSSSQFEKREYCCPKFQKLNLVFVTHLSRHCGRAEAKVASKNTSTNVAKTWSGNVARTTKAIFHWYVNPMAQTAAMRVKFCTTREMRSTMAPFTMVASADNRAVTCELLFSSASNQLTSFVNIPECPNISSQYHIPSTYVLVRAAEGVHESIHQNQTISMPT